MALYKRGEGGEQPYVSLFNGFFKLRFPFIHYNWSWPDAFQGIALACTGLAAIPVLKIIGVSTEIAVLMVFISSCLYLVHSFFGDPVIPGWITAGIPMSIMFLESFPMEERVYALIAAQLMIGILFVLFGTTGIAEKFVRWLPNVVKGGIILGAGIAAVIGEFEEGGRFMQYPYSAGAAIITSFFMLYSKKGMILREKSKIFKRL